MATDPVERIRAFEHETPLALDLPATLARLAELPPATEAPYLTVCLDWRPQGEEPGRLPPPKPKRSQRRAYRHLEGASRRPAREPVERRFAELLDRHGPRGTVFESVKADVDRINAYLDKELDPAAKGVVVVACHHLGIFEPVPLDVPVQTGVVAGPIPSLRQLVHAAEDFPAYAVLVADQREAVLWLMERRTWERSVELEANDYPRKQKQGGWSQRRYQNRADVRVEAFAKTIAQETRRAFLEREQGSKSDQEEKEEQEERIEYLIVAADEPMFSALTDAFHESVAERIIGRVHLPIDANVDQVADEAEPVVERAERRRELEAVQAVRDGVGAGTNGVAGPEDTLTALETAQVMTLVMNDDFSRAGWADYTLSLFGVGQVPAAHPAGGDVANLVPTALEDELVRLAIRTEAGVELVWSAVPLSRDELEHVPDAEEPTPRSEAARALDGVGGVGAILRYILAKGHPTPDL